MNNDEVNQFYYDHRRDLLSYAMIHTQTIHDAEDAVSEAVGKSWQYFLENGRLCPPPSDPVGWLKVTIRNQIVDDWRKRRSAQRLADSCLPAASDFAETVEDQIVAQQGWEFVRTLSPQALEIALLKWDEGLEPKEIAERLKISASTVRVSLLRTRRRMRAALGVTSPDPVPGLDAGEGATS